MAVSPREVFERMQEKFVSGVGLDGELLAEEAIIEAPFAAPGRPRRHVGREAFLAYAGPQQAAFPARFEAVRDVVVHETADPEVLVVEYTLAGVVTTTGRRASAGFIGILRVRDGKIVHWREYQNTLAIAHALGQLPALAAALTDVEPE